MDQILKILSKIKPEITENNLYLPLNETEINSIDLVVIRVALENHFKIEVPEDIWYKFKSLSEAITYLQNNPGLIPTKASIVKTISVTKKYEIGMPQMANNALSENWLLKELGDIHWKMFSKGLEQKSVDLKDDEGNRLYATFIRIQYSLSPLNNFGESEELSLKGKIRRFGNNTYLSEIMGSCNKNKIAANLMTSFSIRESNDNSKILRSNPQERTNQIPQFERMPEFLNEYRLVKNELLKELETNCFKFKIKKKTIGSFEYSINPFFDINGVGLLYYASYPIISDICITSYLKKMSKLIDFETQYYTVHRDILYFANCNISDVIVCKIFVLDNNNDNQLKISSALYRKKDRRLMAKIFTVKEKKTKISTNQ